MSDCGKSLVYQKAYALAVRIVLEVKQPLIVHAHRMVAPTPGPGPVRRHLVL